MAYGKNEVCYMQSLWTKCKVDVDTIKRLQQDYISGDGKDVYYILFSRKSFTDRALGYEARTRSVRLISLMYLK